MSKPPGGPTQQSCLMALSVGKSWRDVQTVAAATGIANQAAGTALKALYMRELVVMQLRSEIRQRRTVPVRRYKINAAGRQHLKRLQQLQNTAHPEG